MPGGISWAVSTHPASLTELVLTSLATSKIMIKFLDPLPVVE